MKTCANLCDVRNPNLIDFSPSTFHEDALVIGETAPPPFPLARSPPHNFVNLKMVAVMNISLAAKVVKAPKVRVKNGCIRNSSRVTGDARRLYVSLRRAEPRRKAPRAL